jgi:adenine/guanine phosphoribosyltransferase-like PRPP-binding protein
MINEAKYDHAYYRRWLIQRKSADECIEQSIKLLRRIEDKFDTIAFIGTSGALCAPIIARELGKELIVVRKESDYKNSHSPKRVEGYRGGRSYILVDDFVDHGGTIERVVEAVSEWAPDCKFIGTMEVNRVDRRKARVRSVKSILNAWRTERQHPDYGTPELYY